MNTKPVTILVVPVFDALADSDMQVGQLRLKRQRYYKLLQKAVEKCNRDTDEEALIFNLYSVLERCSTYHQAASVREWLSDDHKARIYLNDAKLLKKQLDAALKETA